MILRLLCILCVLVATIPGGGAAEEESTKENTRQLPVMTWYHPVLEPGPQAMTLVCTVVKVTQGEQYEKPYWRVRLRIDERIYVQERYTKRLEKIRFLESGDFRTRKVGDRIVVFAGGEPYDGDDFLLPCWSGTNSDLGIFLPRAKDRKTAVEDLLDTLRQQGKDGKTTSESLEAFAEFCPRGVAKKCVWDYRLREWKEGEEKEKREAAEAAKAGREVVK